MAEMKTLNGYEVVDAKARADIETLKQSGGGSSGGSTWQISMSGVWQPELSQSKEVYVRLKNINNNAYYSSCAVFIDTLDNQLGEKFATNAFNSDGSPICWTYDGSRIYLDGNSEGIYELLYVAYKV